MKFLALQMINFYQKYISPYKGFKCAHGVGTGEITCSGYGKKVISKYGIITGLKLLNRRFYDCSWNANKLKEEKLKDLSYKPYQPIGKYKTQGGFIDADCGSCDVPSCDVPSCDIPSCDIPSCEIFSADSCDIFTNLLILDNCIPYNCVPVDCVPDCNCGAGKKYKQSFIEKRNKRNEKKYSNLNEENNNSEDMSEKNDNNEKDFPKEHKE